MAWRLDSGVALRGPRIYGVLSQSVEQRSQEIGVRLALGAGPGRIARQVLGEGLRPAILGGALGLAGALSLSSLLSSLRFRVGARDPLTFAAIAGLLVAVAALACWIPARRAARLDPLRALRDEG